MHKFSVGDAVTCGVGGVFSHSMSLPSHSPHSRPLVSRFPSAAPLLIFLRFYGIFWEFEKFTKFVIFVNLILVITIKILHFPFDFNFLN